MLERVDMVTIIKTFTTLITVAQKYKLNKLYHIVRVF